MDKKRVTKSFLKDFVECRVIDNNKHWFLNDKLHREDGPAAEYTSGNKYWYKYGKEYTPTAHEVITYKIKYNKQ